MQTTIHSLDYEARGVARVGGKTVFVQGALPLETVRIRITQEKASFALADTEAVIEASPFRVQAACASLAILAAGLGRFAGRAGCLRVARVRRRVFR